MIPCSPVPDGTSLIACFRDSSAPGQHTEYFHFGRGKSFSASAAVLLWLPSGSRGLFLASSFPLLAASSPSSSGDMQPRTLRIFTQTARKTRENRTLGLSRVSNHLLWPLSKRPPAGFPALESLARAGDLGSVAYLPELNKLNKKHVVRGVGLASMCASAPNDKPRNPFRTRCPSAADNKPRCRGRH